MFINLGPNIKLIVLNHKKTEIHGHRGCRGYYPENTIPGFLHATQLNIEAIELDVVISKDHEVVVSHEPFMHAKKCLWPNLKPISKEQQELLYLYQMNYETIKQFDCGLLAHPDYPLAQSMPACKPLLKDVIEQVEAKLKDIGTSLVYNIEIKSDEISINKGQPEYVTFVNLVLKVIEEFKLQQRVIIQSFDKEILRSIRKINKEIPISLLIEDAINPFTHIENLGFAPHILACDYVFLNQEIVSSLQQKNMRVFAFTVNHLKDIQQMLFYGVDAIITDYPDIALNCRDSYKNPEK